ncbi:hypothetical protein SCLCIDRAFT_1220212 [Scleroderma citrinum Foug A]|uniref:Uncharacterized protein n=1 Tax=Scleroderma citrinum Foug A TaxID=1036808 RepID=A0A0C3DK03_9AGAM|nr:hypothetical protein SCLCIDRAFT_1220212 [Scleroderma citrinum Foug A]
MRKLPLSRSSPDAPQGVQKQVPGAEAEDTQDLASPAKTRQRTGAQFPTKPGIVI